MNFPIFIHLSIFASFSMLCAAAHGGDVPSSAAGTQCPDRSKNSEQICADQACAARTQKEMEAQLECHKKRMAELAASATMPIPVVAGGNK